MRTILKIAIAGSFLITSLGTTFVSKAAAECGHSERQRAPRQQSLRGQLQFRPASLLLISDDDHESDNGIVGFWRVKFVSKDNPGIPDDTVIDAGFAQWHSDGTEIMNSSRPPATSNVDPPCHRRPSALGDLDPRRMPEALPERGRAACARGIRGSIAQAAPLCSYLSENRRLAPAARRLRPRRSWTCCTVSARTT